MTRRRPRAERGAIRAAPLASLPLAGALVPASPLHAAPFPAAPCLGALLVAAQLAAAGWLTAPVSAQAPPRADTRAAAASAPAATTQSTTAAPAADREAENLATFDRAWSLIAETHWDPTLGGVDWNAVRDELRPQAGAARTDAELRRVLQDMVGRLGQSHFAFLPNPGGDVPRASSSAAASAGETDREAGTPRPARHDDDLLPGCSTTATASIFAAIDRARTGDAEPGVELRLIDRDQVVVTRVLPDTPAARGGVRTGWRLVAVDGAALDPALACLHGIADSAFRHQLVLTWLRGLLDGANGTEARLRFDPGSGRERDLELRREPPPGQLVRFGNLPPSTLRFERSSAVTRRGARVAVVRFNIWLPPVAAAFEQAMAEVRASDAVVIDLRGNPGGVSALAQGVAGHFVAQTLSLGTMKGRRDQLELVAEPRRVARDGAAVVPFAGPLAILIDEGSASTSELFAAGLRDHGRARLFGAPTAGAALPAVMDRLPNGDVFMHAAMDYIRPNGTRVEGHPVEPDVETRLRRSDLRAGKDAALAAALAWVDTELRARRNPSQPGA